MSVGVLAGNAASINIITATVDLGSVAANTSEVETATVPGVVTTDFVIAEKPTLEAGLLIGSCWVSAANTVSIQVINTTAGAIDESSETWRFLVFGRDGASVSGIQR